MKRINSCVIGRRKVLRLRILFIVLSHTMFCLLSPYPYIYAAQKDIKKEDIAAEVNGVPITRKELSDLVSATIPRITGHRTLPEERMTFFRAQALNQLIERELIYQEAKKEKIKTNKAEIEEELKKIKNRYPDEKSFNDDIKRKGLTTDEIKKGLERYLLVTKIMKTKEKEIDEECPRDGVAEDGVGHLFDGVIFGGGGGESA